MLRINSQFGWIKQLGVGSSDSEKRKSDVLGSPLFGFSSNSAMLDSIALRICISYRYFFEVKKVTQKTLCTN